MSIFRSPKLLYLPETFRILDTLNLFNNKASLKYFFKIFMKFDYIFSSQ